MTGGVTAALVLSLRASAFLRASVLFPPDEFSFRRKSPLSPGLLRYPRFPCLG